MGALFYSEIKLPLKSCELGNPVFSKAGGGENRRVGSHAEMLEDASGKSGEGFGEPAEMRINHCAEAFRMARCSEVPQRYLGPVMTRIWPELIQWLVSLMG